MAHYYPHTRLFIGPSTSISITGPHIHLINSSTGTLLFSSTTLPDSDPQKQALIKSGPIRCAAVDRQFRYLITSADDKLLKVWSLLDGDDDGVRLRLESERELPKKPTVLAFTNDASTILVSDKFGDVFSYPFTYTPPTPTQQQQKEKEKEQERSKDPLSSHENPSGGTLILGHASHLNAFQLTPDEKFIITADRDEHIRVSWYPRGYVIEMYCLGHLKFVSAIHILPSDPSSLISGGGDPMLKIWDWKTGKLKRDVDVWEAVEKFVVVRAAKKSGEGKGRRKKGKAKATGQGKVEVEVTGTEDANAMDVDAEGEGKDEGKKEGTSVGEEEKPEKVLVVHRIESVLSEEERPYIVFSAVGATALFAFHYQRDNENEDEVDIRSFDFGRPVLDFSVVDSKTLVVTLDGQWVSEKDEDAAEKNVRVLKVFGGEIVEDLEKFSALRKALNASLLVTATSEEIQKLDIYGALTSMPKHFSEGMEGEGEGEGEGAVWPMGAPELSSSETAKGKKGKGTELNKKEQGRMKVKEAVKAKAQEKEKVEDRDEPEPKRTRS